MKKLTIFYTLGINLLLIICAAAAIGNVTETDSKVAPQACNGSSTTFTFDFPVDATSEVVVKLRTVATGDDETLEETTDYAVSATNNDYSAGGTVTTVATYSSAYTISISRSTTLTQNTTLRDTGTLRFSACNRR